MMPIFGALLGTVILLAIFGFSHEMRELALGLLLIGTYSFQVKSKKNEEQFTREINQLQMRMHALELKLTNQESPPLPKNETLPLPAVEPPQEPPLISTVLPDAAPSYLSRIMAYFSTGNTIAKVGVVLLFFGVAFLLKYVSDQGFFPIELRLTGTACAAAALLVLGWKLRQRPGPFGLLLQGAGIGVFYLTVFASFRLYQLLPATLALALLLLAVALSSCMAVLQDSRALAIFSISGGFLAPVLASTGKGSHVMLFSYYAVLNFGIFGMSWFRSWRDLNIVGFLFTFIISGFWGYRYYRPEFFASTEPFLIFFFLLYFAITLLFANREHPSEPLLMDGTLVFGVPIAAFALQGGLVKDTPYGLAWSAVISAAFYLNAARILLQRSGERLRLLIEAFFAIGICLLTLAVPLALDGKWTAAVWALEGAAILWSGVRQNRFLARCSGMALQVLAGYAFLLTESRPSSLSPILNPFFMGTLVLSLSHLLVGLFLHRADDSRLRPWEKRAIPLFLTVGLLWWFGGGIRELNHAVPALSLSVSHSILINHYVLFLGLSSLLFYSLSERLKWGMLGLVCLGLMPALTWLAAFLFFTSSHPFENIGALAWFIAFLTHYRVLHGRESKAAIGFSGIQHYTALWLLSFLISWEAYWFVNHSLGNLSIWSLVTLAIIPGLFSLAVIRSKESSPWPIGTRRNQYLGIGVAPLLSWAAVWLVFLNLTHSGDPQILPYLPLVNPLDLTQLFVLMVLGAWFMEGKRARLSALPSSRDFSIATGSAVFIWLTAALIRTIHHWTGLPWDFATLFSSNLVQAALSIFWSIVPLGLMILATRRAWRTLWISGSCLLGMVVVKLFLIDLSGRGTLERVISFIGTGVLLLVIGYLAPIPPDAKQPVTEIK